MSEVVDKAVSGNWSELVSSKEEEERNIKKSQDIESSADSAKINVKSDQSDVRNKQIIKSTSAESIIDVEKVSKPGQTISSQPRAGEDPPLKELEKKARKKSIESSSAKTYMQRRL